MILVVLDLLLLSSLELLDFIVKIVNFIKWENERNDAKNFSGYMTKVLQLFILHKYLSILEYLVHLKHHFGGDNFKLLLTRRS